MEYQSLLLPILTSLMIVLLATPSFIKVAELKNLFDEPSEKRKVHSRRVPLMGGMLIFGGSLFSFLLWYPSEDIGTIQFFIPSLLIMFFVGAKDDIISTAPWKKLAAHILVAFIMVLMADVRLTSLHGLFGVREIPLYGSIMLSIFTYIVIINAFNLIDGVDGLAGGIAFIASCAFGAWFFHAGNTVYSVLSFALAGGVLGFLWFNFNPAKIFMGDSGSLLIGFVLAVLAIEIIEYDKSELDPLLQKISKPIFSMAVLVYPLIDTLRVFVIRVLHGTSPFSADRRHLHHRLLDIGLNHKQTVLIIYLFNLLIISLAIFLQDINPSLTFIIIIGLTLAIIQIPFLFKSKTSSSE